MAFLTLFLSIFSLLLMCSSSSAPSPARGSCSKDQRVALTEFLRSLTIKSSASGSCIRDGFTSYPKTLSWKSNIDCCSWDGITCNNLTGEVVGLDLGCSQLYGTIDSNSSLFLLHSLERLNMAFNNFNNSVISPKVSLLSSLTYLNLSSSKFVGVMPSEVSSLSRLVSLDLSGNSLKLVDRGPFRNLTVLQGLYLDSVDMSGDVLLNMSSSLTDLSLQDCNLEGFFPEYILSLPKLEVLNLQGNSLLNGYLDKANWSTVSPLKFLDLSQTNFSGELPISFTFLKSLAHISLHSSRFSGSLPQSLGNLTRINYLDLSGTRLTGKIPPTLSNLAHLVYIDLAFCNFDGQIPDVFSNQTHIVSVDFSHNQLAGPLPHTIRGLSDLVELNLAYNFVLNGTIPSWLFELPSLKSLDLSDNQLTGRIYEFQYSSLQDLRLDRNKLSGPIPRSLFSLVSLANLDLSYNNFSGIMDLSLFSSLVNLIVADVSNNKHLSFSSSNAINFTLVNMGIFSMASCNASEFPEIVRALEFVSMLDLSDNGIRGPIPNWMGDAGYNSTSGKNVGYYSMSYLNLSCNFLTDLENLPLDWMVLGCLDLHSNLFEGTLRFPLSINISYMSFSDNQFSGGFPLSVCNMSSLRILDLSNNNLNGEIPNCLGSFSTNLELLNLRNNSLYGVIPQTFTKGNMLRTLDLSHNHLHGTVPRSLVNCTNLEVLDIGYNMINDSFPFLLETLPELKVLILRSNYFYGLVGLPRSTPSFANLSIIDLSCNRFSGPLPSHYFESWTSMMVDHTVMSRLKYSSGYISGFRPSYYVVSVTITAKGLAMQLENTLTVFKAVDFSDNMFTGNIPDNIGDLKALHLLNLSSNGLTGPISSSLGNLRDLESLDLSRNKLSGEIPQDLASLTYLAIFNVSQNQLTGPIPRGAQFGTFFNTSYQRNSGLCGPPLSSECGNKKAPPTLPSLSKSIWNDFVWESVLLGCGFGTLIGICMGHCLIHRKEAYVLQFFGFSNNQRRKRSRGSRI